MKTLISAILMALFCGSLVACSGDNSSEAPDPDKLTISNIPTSNVETPESLKQ